MREGWPRLPERVPFTRWGCIGGVAVGDDVEWQWCWTECDGSIVTRTDGDEPAPAYVCPQPGVCIVHDPPGSVVPY
jgi:hypothetical protein